MSLRFRRFVAISAADTHLFGLAVKFPAMIAVRESIFAGARAAIGRRV
ncbi:MAG: hypothetical protein M9932_10505 [Xanthobacteraceae bacterium]|nr:hypothetical protein [Xanthobacteraceae bacterium]